MSEAPQVKLERKSSNASISSTITKAEGKMRRARNEADSLRKEICQLQMRLEEVETERNYNLVKATELQKLVASQERGEEFLQKALQSADMQKKVDKLTAEIKILTEENHKLKTARHRDKTNMEKMSGVVRSLQYGSGDDVEIYDPEKDAVLSTEQALFMTMKQMKRHIEKVEDRRDELETKCHDQEVKIKELENDNELKEVKVRMLEELFRSMNDEERTPPPRQKQQAKSAERPRPRLEKSNSLPNLLSLLRIRPAAVTESPATNPKKNDDSNASTCTTSQNTASNLTVDNALERPKNVTMTPEVTRNTVSNSKLASGLMTPSNGTGKPLSSATMNMLKSDFQQGKRLSKAAQMSPSPRRKSKTVSGAKNQPKPLLSKAAANDDEERRPGISKTKSLPLDAKIPKQPSRPAPRPILKKSNSESRLTVRERRAAANRAAEGGERKEEHKEAEHMKVGNWSKVIVVGDREGAYTGPMKNGLPNGVGSIRFSNGDTYLGDVKDGKMNGRGTFYHTDRKLGIVRGSFRNNEHVDD